MLSHTIEQGVLVITVLRDPGISGRAAVSETISELVHAHRSRPVVIVLDDGAAGPAAVSAVLRAHRMCGHLGILMSIATHSAAARRLLESNAHTEGSRPVIHARTDTAITTALTADTAAA
ncbi:hypothetical protein [Streptomyces sp. NPDC054887]